MAGNFKLKYLSVCDIANADITDSFNIDADRLANWTNELRIKTAGVIAIDFIRSELMISFNKHVFNIKEISCADIGIHAGSIEVCGERIILRATHHGDGLYKLDILIRKVLHLKLEFRKGNAIDVANYYGKDNTLRCTQFYCSVNSKYRLARVNDL